MSRRIDKSWTVFASIENDEHDKCVDIFSRPDSTFGFEEFRRDVEDQGEWTPLGYYSGKSYPSSEAAYEAAEGSVPWFADMLVRKPALRRHPG
ncbi:MAG: hypothetical protein P4M09_05770 [Devosia sp.]|nr:hypothetical protein [Devosia sp.]